MRMPKVWTSDNIKKIFKNDWTKESEDAFIKKSAYLELLEKAKELSYILNRSNVVQYNAKMDFELWLDKNK